MRLRHTTKRPRPSHTNHVQLHQMPHSRRTILQKQTIPRTRHKRSQTPQPTILRLLKQRSMQMSNRRNRRLSYNTQHNSTTRTQRRRLKRDQVTTTRLRLKRRPMPRPTRPQMRNPMLRNTQQLPTDTIHLKGNHRNNRENCPPNHNQSQTHTRQTNTSHRKVTKLTRTSTQPRITTSTTINTTVTSKTLSGLTSADAFYICSYYVYRF